MPPPETLRNTPQSTETERNSIERETTRRSSGWNKLQQPPSSRCNPDQSICRKEGQEKRLDSPDDRKRFNGSGAFLWCSFQVYVEMHFGIHGQHRNLGGVQERLKKRWLTGKQNTFERRPNRGSLLRPGWSLPLVL